MSCVGRYSAAARHGQSSWITSISPGEAFYNVELEPKLPIARPVSCIVSANAQLLNSSGRISLRIYAYRG
jgi:hypothetical protein